MPTPFRISAKTLGEIALEKFYARCFWRKIHVSKLDMVYFDAVSD